MCRGRTLYLPWTKVTMLPSALAEGPLSLSSTQPSNAISFVAHISANGKLTSFSIEPSKIQARARLTYHDADSVLAGKVPGGEVSTEARAALEVRY